MPFIRRRSLLTVVAAMAVAVPTASAQLVPASGLASASLMAAASSTAGELHGVVKDDQGQALAGAVVSALGDSTVFAVSDRDGRFAFRILPAGPYLVRVHLQGYAPARGRMLQVIAGTRQTTAISLVRITPTEGTPPVVAAGVGVADAPDVEPSDEPEHKHDEVAWRLRHLKRSVLKDAAHAVAGLDHGRSLMGDSFSGLSRAVEGSARLATAMLADLPLTGQFNLLTTTSFHNPQDLFADDLGAPRSVAYLSLEAPGADGDWRVRGTITQGDVSSWILAASYVRTTLGAHRYQAGVSYATQRYLGGNAEALAAIREGDRNVGAMYAYDDWKVAPRLSVGYGAKYATHDYLEDGGLLSPRASVTVQPSTRDSLRLRATVAHRETAPGADEFLPPTVGLWLPPERTFSHVSRGAFLPERLDHVEIAAEREWFGNVVVGVRAFRQRVEDQVVTLFGVAVEPGASVGHYQVGSGGDFRATGWGVSVSRDVGTGIRTSVDYTTMDSDRTRRSADARAVAAVAGMAIRPSARIHDVTASVESVVAPTATRLFVIYKMNSAFSGVRSPMTTARFNVQVNQALPFLDFANAHWEMLMAVSNLFRDDLVDASVYDEVMVIHAPKRVLGGVTVRF